MLNIIRSQELMNSPTYPRPTVLILIFDRSSRPYRRDFRASSFFQLPHSSFRIPKPQPPSTSPHRLALCAMPFALCFCFRLSNSQTSVLSTRSSVLYVASQPPCIPAIAASQKARQAPWFWLRPVTYILLLCRRDAPVVPYRGPDVR